MSKGNVIKITVFLSLLFIEVIDVFPQDTGVPAVQLMFYNVENLFDIHDDTLTDDDEFLPGGLRHWTYGRYDRKINSIFRTIVAAGEWSPPAIVALCEVENRKVLEDLIYGTYLSKYKYEIIQEDSPDLRGIDVCLIFRKEQVKIIDYQYLIPSAGKESGFSSRSVLYARCLICSDTIHLFINHWPSRRGGVLAGEEQRTQIAEMVRGKADSIARISSGSARIMLVGDFNATPDDKVINLLTRKNDQGASIINLSRSIDGASGTYRYQGTWEMIDQVLVSDILINCNNGLSNGSIRVFNPDFLLKYDSKYPGMSPFSTYSGYRYQGGYSDHLPVIIDLIVK